MRRVLVIAAAATGLLAAGLAPAHAAPAKPQIINVMFPYAMQQPVVGDWWWVSEGTTDAGYPGPYYAASYTNGIDGLGVDQRMEWENGGWTLIYNGETGKCLAYVAWNNTLNDQPCSTAKSWELWNSQEAPNRNEWFWNQWEQTNYPHACYSNSGFQPVITFNGDGSVLNLACPKAGYQQYDWTQDWDPVPNLLGI